MAEGKKSVLLYCDIIHTVEPLTDEEAGRLFKHYLRYINDQNPCAEDRLTSLLFEPIKQNLKRDLRKWEEKSERNSLIAKEGWEKRKNANASESIKQDAKNADKDKVIVKVKVTDIDKVKVRELVILSQQEINTLRESFTEQDCNWMYDKLNNYKLSSGKKYKSDYGAINSWVKDELKKHRLANPIKKPTKELGA